MVTRGPFKGIKGQIKTKMKLKSYHIGWFDRPENGGKVTNSTLALMSILFRIKITGI